jgi:hypothetical protein
MRSRHCSRYEPDLRSVAVDAWALERGTCVAPLSSARATTYDQQLGGGGGGATYFVSQIVIEL